jgi:hypothetical protein
MAYSTVRFNVYAPGHDVVLLGLSKLIGVRTLHTDIDGRRYVIMPDPYADVRVYDGETLTPAKCARLASAIEYFAEHPLCALQSDGAAAASRASTEDRALRILNAAGFLATQVGSRQKSE